jgi:alkylated DNA nucleotide flippase Atl1
LHQILEDLPSGRWTTYGDLADAIGTAPQPLGAHLNTCRQCLHPWRVLTAAGRVAPEFAWNDATDQRDPQELLLGEGVGFVNGVADPERRLTSDELATLIEVEEG